MEWWEVLIILSLNLIYIWVVPSVNMVLNPRPVFLELQDPSRIAWNIKNPNPETPIQLFWDRARDYTHTSL